ncbi:MAG: ABC transporter permease [Rhizobiaceae bacterium]
MWLSALPLAFRFALRELRGGLMGFRVFIACIALGVAAIGAVNSVAGGIAASIEREGRSILGGDIGLELVQREASPDELKRMEALGTMSKTMSLRSMARLEDGSDQNLVEVKAVDAAYPLYGAVKTNSTAALTELLKLDNGHYGALVPQILFDRLQLKLRDKLLLGDIKLEVRGVLQSEPDALSEGFIFAPRLMISLDALKSAGLLREGSLAETSYKIKLADERSKAGLETIQAQLRTDLGDKGYRVRTSNNASPGLTDAVDRFSQFLALVALCALLVGGVGVANAVQAHLDGKRSVIATFKSLGAGGGFVATVYMIQILVIGLAGALIGMVIAALVPQLTASILMQYLPLNIERSVQMAPLLLAGLFGMLTTLGFALIPLGRTKDVKPTLLFRDAALDGSGQAAWSWRIAAFAVLGLTAGLAIIVSDEKRTAISFLSGALAGFMLLGFVAQLVIGLARRAPRARSTVWRLAVGNLYRPGAITRPVVISLGLGLTLLAAISLIDVNLRSQISGNIAGRAPDFFFTDIQSKEVEGFAGLLAKAAPQGTIQTVPMLRGRITKLKDIEIANYNVPPEAAWVLRGDRGITYSPDMPENSILSEGEWWPADYTGEPLVSFSAEEAGELGLKLGDTVTVNVLGRDITAKIANLRKVEWRSLSINFVMVFSPSIFKGAPHAWLATLSDPSATAAQEGAILTEVTRTYPAITSVRVKDALALANNFVAQFATAVRVAASVALVASVLVLAGALAAGNRARVRDAVVLKMLGATRRTLVSAFVLEYLLIGLATAVFALIAGTLAAWLVVTRLMNLTFYPEPMVAVLTIGLSLLLTIGMGLAGTWRILGQKSAPVLRTI